MESSAVIPHPSQVLAKCVRQVAQQDWGNYADATIALLINLYAEYGEPEVGRTRAVFNTQKGTVIKVALNDEGEMASSGENYTSQMLDPFIPVASCRVEKIDNVEVLIMETVTPVPYDRDMPEWVDYVDCQQVGYTSKGWLVAYDL